MTTIRELFDKHSKHAETYYKSSPAELRHLAAVRLATNQAVSLDMPVESFGPLSLIAVRDQMVLTGWCRSYTNKQVRRLVAIFAWAVSREMCPVTVAQALEYVAPLRAGSCSVREGKGPVMDVKQEVVDATLRELPTQELRDLVQVQLLTASRGAEILAMRPMDLRFKGDTADYVPASHKTSHRGKSRTIVLGPRALEIVKRRMPMNVTERIFPSFNTNSYREAVKRAAARAGVSLWSPHRLRHAGCTKVAAEFGIEAAAHVAGHANLNTAQIYSHHGVEDARRVAREVG